MNYHFIVVFFERSVKVLKVHSQTSLSAARSEINFFYKTSHTDTQTQLICCNKLNKELAIEPPISSEFRKNFYSQIHTINHKTIRSYLNNILSWTPFTLLSNTWPLVAKLSKVQMFDLEIKYILSNQLMRKRKAITGPQNADQTELNR